MLKKIIMVQCEVGRQLSLEDNLLIFKQRPDFVVLPEYFNVNPDHRDTERNSAEGHELLTYCRTLSDRFDSVVVAGSAVEFDGHHFYNCCTVYNRGNIALSYRKTNPTVNERKHNITPGEHQIICEIGGVRISVLICADVLDPDNFVRLRSESPDIVFIPTTSPYRPDETVRDKFARDNDIFVQGARLSGAYLVKCCAIGQLWGGTLQGRSSISAPWGVISRVSPLEESKKRILSMVLDIDELREFRRKQDLYAHNK